MCCEKEIGREKAETNLTERLEKFYEKPIEEIYVEKSEEIALGDPAGEEIW